MKYINSEKKSLYESIMQDVAKSVKRHINEDISRTASVLELRFEYSMNQHRDQLITELNLNRRSEIIFKEELSKPLGFFGIGREEKACQRVILFNADSVNRFIKTLNEYYKNNNKTIKPVQLLNTLTAYYTCRSLQMYNNMECLYDMVYYIKKNLWDSISKVFKVDVPYRIIDEIYTNGAIKNRKHEFSPDNEKHILTPRDKRTWDYKL